MQRSLASRCHARMRTFNTEQSWQGITALAVRVSTRRPRRIIKSHDCGANETAGSAVYQHRQMRLTHTNVAGRSPAGKSRTHVGGRSCSLACAPHGGHTRSPQWSRSHTPARQRDRIRPERPCLPNQASPWHYCCCSPGALLIVFANTTDHQAPGTRPIPRLRRTTVSPQRYHDSLRRARKPSGAQPVLQVFANSTTASPPAAALVCAEFAASGSNSGPFDEQTLLGVLARRPRHAR